MSRTIVLNGPLGRHYEENLASVACKPGHLLELTSDSPQKVKPHTVRGGRVIRSVAIEDAFVGRTIDDEYAIGEVVRQVYADPGDIHQQHQHAGENVLAGDWIISYGDGTVCKAATSFLQNNVAASTPITASSTEVAFSNGVVTIPKNTLKVGSTIRIRGQGIATATNSTDTLTVKGYLGTIAGTALFTTGALDVADNDIFTFDLTLVVRTIGASGTFVTSGMVSIGASGTATMKEVFLGSTAIDTTVDNTLSFSGKWSTTSGSNSARLDVLNVEHVAPGSSAAAGSAGGDVIGVARDALDLSGETDPDFLAVIWR